MTPVAALMADSALPEHASTTEVELSDAPEPLPADPLERDAERGRQQAALRAMLDGGPDAVERNASCFQSCCKRLKLEQRLAGGDAKGKRPDPRANRGSLLA